MLPVVRNDQLRRATFFDGSDDVFRTSAGFWNGRIPDGLLALAIARSLGATGFRQILTGYNGSNNAVLTLARNSADVLVSDTAAAGTLALSAPTLTIADSGADGFCLYGYARAPGTSTARFYKLPLETRVFSAENDNTTHIAPTATLAGFAHGAWYDAGAAADFFNGEIIATGLFQLAALPSDELVRRMAFDLALWDRLPGEWFRYDRAGGFRSMSGRCHELTGSRVGTRHTTASESAALPKVRHSRRAFIPVDVPAAGQTLAIGTPTEADTAPPLGRSKTKAIGTAASTEAGIAIGRSKSKPLTLAIDVNTAQPLGRKKTRALTAATEAHAAQPLDRSKLRAIAATLETAAAIALGRLKSRLIGAPGESDSGQPVGVGAGGSVNPALETHTAIAIGRRKTKAINPATEPDTASNTPARKQRALGTVTELTASLSLGRTKTKALTAALETGVAQLLGRLKRRLLGTATEVDEALELDFAGALAEYRARAETPARFALAAVSHRSYKANAATPATYTLEATDEI